MPKPKERRGLVTLAILTLLLGTLGTWWRCSREKIPASLGDEKMYETIKKNLSPDTSGMNVIQRGSPAKERKKKGKKKSERRKKEKAEKPVKEKKEKKSTPKKEKPFYGVLDDEMPDVGGDVLYNELPDEEDLLYDEMPDVDGDLLYKERKGE